MIMMPNEVALEFTLAHFSAEDVMDWIRQLIDSLEHDPEQKWKNGLIQICRREAGNLYMRRGEGLMASVIKACTTLKDAQELLMAIKGCSASRPGSSVHLAVAQALHFLPFRDVKPR